ncbi:MAG: YybH family protein [Lachnospiraceae bacterium]
MEPRKEIEQLVERYANAIHSQDETDFRSVWTQEDTNVLISGDKIFQGPDSIYQDFVIGMIQTKFSSIYLVNDGLQAYLLNDTAAVVIFRYHTECILRDTGEPHGIAGIETQVLKKTDNGWRIAHIQYSGKPINTTIRQ